LSRQGAATKPVREQMHPWKTQPWSNRVRWYEQDLYEHTEKWKLEAWPCCFLLEPAQVASELPVVLWTKVRVPEARGSFVRAMIHGTVYAHGAPPVDLDLPVRSLFSYVDYRFTDERFLSRPLPKLMGERAAIETDLAKLIKFILWGQFPKPQVVEPIVSAARDAHKPRQLGLFLCPPFIPLGMVESWWSPTPFALTWIQTNRSQTRSLLCFGRAKICKARCAG